MRNSWRRLLSRTTAGLLASCSFMVQAHDGGTTLDPGGQNPQATDMAYISCGDDGNGPPAYLYADIKDLSPPVPGLYLNLQVQKGRSAANTTDTVPGDASPSQPIMLWGGGGAYLVMVNKTGPGPRAFLLTWHCMTADHRHTGTDIQVLQIQ